MKFIPLLLPAAAALVCGLAQSATPLLDAELSGFAVLGASAVTNTGATLLTGDLGVSNNASPTGITGFFGTLANDGPGIATGNIYQGNAYAMQADGQLANAINGLNLMGPGTNLGADLSGLSLMPGVYSVDAGASNLTGALTLDGGGNANAAWVFQLPSSLITSAGSFMAIVNTGPGAGVYWNVGSSATLGASSSFLGNILAQTSITLNAGVTLGCGRALAHTGAVTLINDTVNATDCLGTTVSGSQGLSGGLSVAEIGAIPTTLAYSPVSAVPEPSTYALLLAGLGCVAAMVKRRNTRHTA